MITPQSANWTTLAQKAGKGMRLLAYVEGIANPITTATHVDPRTKTYAVDFDGTDDYIDCGSNTALQDIGDWTLIAWIKPDTLSNGSVYTIAGAWDNAAPLGYRVALSVSGGVGSIQVKFGGGAAGGYTLAGATVAVNAWTYIAVSVGGITTTVIRGQIGSTELTPQTAAVSRATRANTTPGQAFQIAHAQGASYFNGRIGYVAVYNRALSPDEMRRVKFRRLTKTWGDDDSGGIWNSMVAQWDLERGTGTTAKNTGPTATADWTTSTHDGTLTNGPTWQSDACYDATHKPYLFAEATTEQRIDPLGTRTSISATTLRILDTAEWFTGQLYSLGMALLGKRVDLFMGFDGCLEHEFQRVFIGRISDVSYFGKAYTIRVGDGLLDGKKRIAIGRTTIQDAMTNAAGQDANVPVGSYWANPGITSASQCYLKIDDELILTSADAGVSAAKFALDGTTRAQFGTAAAAHSSGAAISEVWRLVYSDPEVLLLYLLISGGSGYEDTSAYDLLIEFTYTDATTRSTRGRGMGLSPSDVAVAEIAALASTVFNVSGPTDLIVDEDVDDIKDFLEREFLRGYGAFFFVKSDGRISVGSHAIPSASVYDLDPTRTYRFEWSVSYDDMCNLVVVTGDYDPGTQEYDGLAFFDDAAAGQKYGLKKREYTFKNAEATFTGSALADTILARFTEPYRTIAVTCGFYEFVLEIGDCVSLTNLNLPNVATGTLGVHEKLWQIIGRQVDFRSGRVRLTLADVSDL